MLQTRMIVYFGALTLTALAVVLYAWERELPEEYGDYLDTEQAVEDLSNRLEELKAREKRLADRVEYLGSDPVEIEAAIRKSKNLVREGETVYRLKSVEDLPSPDR